MMSRRKRRPARRGGQPVAGATLPTWSRRERPVEVFAGVGLLALCAVLAWANARTTGDTFMTLKGGQDAFRGKLGAPDDWAHTTHGRVWINQNWGTGVLFYAAHDLMGGTGLVVVKGLVIAVLTIFLFLAARRFGGSLTMSMLATATSLLGMRYYMDIRANVIGLAWMAVFLWTLFWSRKHPHRTWLTLPMLTIWANMHGSFIFGIGMLGLWVVCTGVAVLTQRAPRDAWRRLWPLPVCVCLAFALAAIASPFGIKNLTQPLTLLFGVGGEAWPLPADEMDSIFETTSSLLGMQPFFLLVGMVVAPAVCWVVCLRFYPGENRRVDWTTRADWLFAAGLFIVTVTMAILAKRFIPVAILFFAPVLALEFTWLASRPRLAWLTALVLPILLVSTPAVEHLVGLVQQDHTARGGDTAWSDSRLAWMIVSVTLVAIPILLSVAARLATPRSGPSALAQWLEQDDLRSVPVLILAGTLLAASYSSARATWRHYRTDHPLYPPQSVFERMVKFSNFPAGAQAFLNMNGIEGRVFNDWRWEGFLRWYCPGIKVFIGGRSRQIYTPETARAWLSVWNGRGVHSLKDRGVYLMIISTLRSDFASTLMLTRNSPWAAVYFDKTALVLASRQSPATSQLIDAAAHGRLQYPDPAVAEASRAACLMCHTVGARESDIREAVVEGTQAYPNRMLYGLLANLVSAKMISGRWVLTFFESELRRLEEADYYAAEGLHILSSRIMISRLFGQWHESARRPEEARQWRDYASQLNALSIAIRDGRPEPKVDPMPAAL